MLPSLRPKLRYDRFVKNPSFIESLNYETAIISKNLGQRKKKGTSMYDRVEVRLCET